MGFSNANPDRHDSLVFESSVNLWGSQTSGLRRKRARLFESSVNLWGSQTHQGAQGAQA